MIMVAMLVLGCFVAVYLSGCSRARADINTSAELPMEVALPPIDTVTHGHLETAYFALG